MYAKQRPSAKLPLRWESHTSKNLKKSVFVIMAHYEITPIIAQFLLIEKLHARMLEIMQDVALARKIPFRLSYIWRRARMGGSPTQ